MEKKAEESETNFIRRFEDVINKLGNQGVKMDERIQGFHLIDGLKADAADQAL